MSWLHCMWGLGATAGPYIMGIALSAGAGWNMGYRMVSLLQVILTILLFASIPLWRSHSPMQTADQQSRKGRRKR